MKKGFTLIELLVVVLIIGILTSIALPQYSRAVKRSKGVKMITKGRSVADAVNRYYLENGSYSGLRYESDGGYRAGMNVSKLDIDFGSNWAVGLGSCGGQECIFCVGNVDLECYDGIGLRYHLSQGKITKVSCVVGMATELCRDYFQEGVYEGSW